MKLYGQSENVNKKDIEKNEKASGEYLRNKLLELIDTDYYTCFREGSVVPTGYPGWSPNNIKNVIITPEFMGVEYYITPSTVKSARGNDRIRIPESKIHLNRVYSDKKDMCRVSKDYKPVLSALARDRVCSAIEEIVISVAGNGYKETIRDEYMNLSGMMDYNKDKTTLMDRYSRLKYVTCIDVEPDVLVKLLAKYAMVQKASLVYLTDFLISEGVLILKKYDLRKDARGIFPNLQPLDSQGRGYHYDKNELHKFMVNYIDKERKLKRSLNEDEELIKNLTRKGTSEKREEIELDRIAIELSTCSLNAIKLASELIERQNLCDLMRSEGVKLSFTSGRSINYIRLVESAIFKFERLSVPKGSINRIKASTDAIELFTSFLTERDDGSMPKEDNDIANMFKMYSMGLVQVAYMVLIDILEDTINKFGVAVKLRLNSINGVINVPTDTVIKDSSLLKGYIENKVGLTVREVIESYSTMLDIISSIISNKSSKYYRLDKNKISKLLREEVNNE